MNVIIGIILLFCIATNAQKVRVCYWGSWSLGRFDFNQLKQAADKCTHVVFAFANVDRNGGISLTNPSLMTTFTSLKTSIPSVKLMIAVGGADGASGDAFTSISSSAAITNKFGDNAVAFLSQYKLDGLDMDWEYPTGYKSQFVSLLQGIKPKLSSKGFLLTAAVGADKAHVDSCYDPKLISDNVDWINLMTYDLHGAWWPNTALSHCSLFQGSDPVIGMNADACVQAWIGGGAPASKLVLGAAAYGRSYSLSSLQTGVNSPISGPGNPGSVSVTSGILFYSEICANKWALGSDLSTGPYAVSGNQWVGYDDPGSVQAKCDYIKRKGLGGIMFWSIDQDDCRNACNMGNCPLLTAAKTYCGDGSTEPTPATTKIPGTQPVTTKAPVTQPGTTNKSTATTKTSGTFTCTTDGYFKDPLDINKYIWCAGGNKYSMSCAPGTSFDATSSSCR